MHRSRRLPTCLLLSGYKSLIGLREKKAAGVTAPAQLSVLVLYHCGCTYSSHFIDIIITSELLLLMLQLGVDNGVSLRKYALLSPAPRRGNGVLKYDNVV